MDVQAEAQRRPRCPPDALALQPRSRGRHGKLAAIDMKTGVLKWETKLVNSEKLTVGFTGAPLLVKDKIIIGSQGGEWPDRGPIFGVNAKTGEKVWEFKTAGGNDGTASDARKTWGGDSYKTGGGGGCRRAEGGGTGGGGGAGVHPILDGRDRRIEAVWRDPSDAL
ncbi:MAG: hypothetical protein B7Z52_07530 [Burkholderiales bacterium 12-64-5]|nr:MAG: hypothetical protein B7Z52_07530 [Burkholderiales bacterium 12-64-5]